MIIFLLKVSKEAVPNQTSCFFWGFDDLWISCCASSPGMDHTTKYWRIHLVSSSNARFENLSSLFRLACLINSFSFANPEYIWIYYGIFDHFLGDIGMDGIIWFTHWELWTYSITFLHITAHFKMLWTRGTGKTNYCAVIPSVLHQS